MEKKLDENTILTVLDKLYDKALDGIPKVSKPIADLAKDYLDKNASVESAAKEMIKYQMAKCGTSGFVSGLGGVLTLAVALPANITSVLYIQLRMIAAIAYMGGFDIQSDQVQTIVYACLTGSAVSDVLKQAGIKTGQKIAVSLINKIPGRVLISINKKVGFRLLTKFGTKGVVNLVKLVPLAGGVVGGAIDVGTTKIIANNAYNIFINKELKSGSYD